jgi:hypothetical protein
VMASDSSTHECRVIWIREKRVGLAFVKPAGALDGERATT